MSCYIMIFRWDYIFSYWIFFWYLLYTFKLTNKNPLIAFIFGLIENLFVLLAMIFYGSKYAWRFLINIFIFKCVPIYFLTKKSYNITIKDAWFTLWIFSIYVIWLIVNNISIYEVYKKSIKSLINDTNETPFMQLFEKITTNNH
jgi:hypothetical protein